jgi:two-component system, cell cycle sensor histidine kinase and response regulator CckA
MPSDIASPLSPLAAEIGPLADANCIVLCLDDGGRITFLNPFGLNFFGYQQSEIKGCPAIGTIFLPKEHCDLNPAHKIGSPACQPAGDAHQISECRRKEGDRRWVVWSSRAFRDTAGEVTEHLCIGHDVTDYKTNATKLEEDRKQLAGTLQWQNTRLQEVKERLREEDEEAHENDMRALKEGQDRYRLFSTVSTEGILFHDNGIAMEVNEALVAMVECPRDQIIGMDIVRRFIVPEDALQVKQKMASNGDHLYEVTARSAKGRTFPVELRSRPGKLGDRPCRVVCVRDISHRKKTERQMIQSQKMEAIGTLASGIVHDFNNMLAGIQGNVEVIRHQLSLKSPHQKGLDLISQIVERGAKLSGQILGYARGGQSEITEINLNRLVEDTLAMFGSANKQINVQTRLSTNTPGVRGDRTQIEQILLNLMINAVHAMPSGGNLMIETKPAVLTNDIKRPYEIIPGDYAMLAVHDTGHGMDQETQKLIFEPFFTTKARGQGTGLGLASTYGIIKNHKGYIDVSSEPGVGSRFSVLLPASTGKEKPTPADTRVEKGSETILMVDDEADFLVLGRQMLTLLGYQPITAGDCDEALTQFKQSAGKVNLVIMDMIMPGGAVDETIQKLREIDPAVRILLSSGHSQNGETGRKLMQNCNGFIQKPFRLASLSQKIKELLGTAKNEDQ